MSKDAEELVFDLPADEVTVGGEPSSPEAQKVTPDVAPAAKDEGDGVEVNVALDEIQRDLDASRRATEEKAREAEEAKRVALAERAARAKLEEDVHGLRNERLRSAWDLANSELQQIANGIASVAQEKEAAKRDYKIAFEANDADAAAAAQERLAAAVADLKTLESGKAGAENEVRRIEAHVRRAREVGNQPQPQQREQQQPAPKQQTPDDWIGQVRSVYGSKPADWLNDHKEFVTDPKLNQKMLKFAEYYQTVEEKPLNSADFITALNEKFFPQERAMDDEQPRSKTATPAAKRITPSAPVSNGASFFSSNNMDAKKVKLPPALAKFADEAKLNKTLYAEGIVKDIKAGKLPKNYLDPDYPHEFV